VLRRRPTKHAVGLSVVIIAALAASLAPAAVVEQGNLRVTLLSQIEPHRLPRHTQAPIAVFVSGHVDAVQTGIPPQLVKLNIKVNRHGLLQWKGLPVCPVTRIQPSSTEDAIERCGDAIIGSGQFWAHIVLAGQNPYPTRGRLLVFNGRTASGKPAVLAHIFTANPFASSFVIPFQIKHLKDGGAFGTELGASLPEALGEWGYVDRIKLTLRRKYRYGGKQRSYYNANCPAPAGTFSAVYPIALATFSFEDEQVTAEVTKSCGVKGE
jgi:hypothetical protein